VGSPAGSRIPRTCERPEHLKTRAPANQNPGTRPREQSENRSSRLRSRPKVSPAPPTSSRPDAFIVEFCRRSRLDVSGFDALFDVGRAHWERLRWLRDHAAHGSLQFVKPKNCVQPPRGHWGPGVYVTCSCRARLAILRELLPPEFEPLVSPISEEQQALR
jgi:hypothetical protein